jgi:hypothetical protein
MHDASSTTDLPLRPRLVAIAPSTHPPLHLVQAGHRGRDEKEPIAWLRERGRTWRDEAACATLDLPGSYQAVYDLMLSDAAQVVDAFYAVKLAALHLAPCSSSTVRTRQFEAAKSTRRYKRPGRLTV